MAHGVFFLKMENVRGRESPPNVATNLASHPTAAVNKVGLAVRKTKSWLPKKRVFKPFSQGPLTSCPCAGFELGPCGFAHRFKAHSASRDNRFSISIIDLAASATNSIGLQKRVERFRV